MTTHVCSTCAHASAIRDNDDIERGRVDERELCALAATDEPSVCILHLSDPASHEHSFHVNREEKFFSPQP